MRTHVKTTVILTVILLTLLFFWGQPAWAVTPQQLKMMKGQKKGEAAEEVQQPEQLHSGQIDAFMATLSDEQVRRLLIDDAFRIGDYVETAGQRGIDNTRFSIPQEEQFLKGDCHEETQYCPDPPPYLCWLFHQGSQIILRVRRTRCFLRGNPEAGSFIDGNMGRSLYQRC